MSFSEHLHQRLHIHAAEDLYRQRMIPGKVLSFCSNDYLGLSQHPDLIAASQEATKQWGVGSGASHLICGYRSIHQELEEAFAKFLKRDRALLFNNGYMANLGVMQALLQKNDIVYQDKLNHASLIDAALLSKGELRRYAHKDISHLTRLLEQQQSGKKLIATDSVFSMEGDLAPLPQLAALAREYGAWLMVDDAHGIGLLGERGEGSLGHFDLSQDEVPILVCPLGKAFGGFGAIVAGSETLIESLIQFSRTYIYTTALPPALAAAMSTSLHLIATQSQLRQDLKENIAYFKKGAQERGLAFLESSTPIQSLIVKNAALSLNIQKSLLQQGLLVSAIRPPTVPAQTSRIRISLSAHHQHNDIDRLLEALLQSVEEGP